jgi:protoporphyrinogen oxidase
MPVAVIGAGVAGLTAAAFLRRHNVPVVLYEASKQISGLAASFYDDEGFSYDFGAHFVTNRLAAAIGIGDRCRDVHHYGETVFLRGRKHSYPFGLAALPRFAASALRSRAATWVGVEGRKPTTAAEWFRARYGAALADEVTLPLVEAWSGTTASELAPSVGEKLQANALGHAIFLKLAARWTGRAVANGYSHEMPESPHVWHVYPQGGVSLLCRKLAEGLHDSIRLESPVEQILVDRGEAVAVRANGVEQPVSAVVSTAPCSVLPKLLRGSNELDYLASFRYRPMIFVNLRFHGRGLLPDTVLWIPEGQFPFFRLTEATLSMPWLAPPGKTLITADIGAVVGDTAWTSADDQLGELCVEHLLPLIPDARSRYLGCHVLRTPFAYPVYHKGYEADRIRFESSIAISGLYSIGRNGEFAHILMEDVYWRTLKRMRQALVTRGEQ